MFVMDSFSFGAYQRLVSACFLCMRKINGIKVFVGSTTILSVRGSGFIVVFVRKADAFLACPFLFCQVGRSSLGFAGAELLSQSHV